ncbi:MAG: ATP-binding protein [Chthoniobacteraceae bacterium]
MNDRLVLQENHPMEFIETVPDKSGVVKQWLSFKFPIEDELGRRFLGGVSLDVTEKRKAELLLQESEAAFRELFDEAPVAYHEVDTQGCLTRVNHTELSLLGYTAEEMVGKPVWTFIQDRMSPEAIRAKLTGEMQLKTYERTFRRKDGTLVPMLIEERLMKDSDGKVSGIRSTLQDISRRKEIENELAEAMDVALESARVKSQFLANMSHEIRTPMNGIIGMTDLLLDTQMNAKQQDFARTIQASAAGLLHIINDILDFSKMEAGMMRFDTVEFDLREVVESTVEMLACRALQKGIELQSLVDHNLPERVSGDPGRLRQVLANLTGNAIKFTDRGAVLVEATRRQDEKGQVTICFSIQDTGIGISAEQQDRLFQPFSQADGSTTRKYGGTGLGLAISKQIVEQMGGEIGVESSAGIGSHFWFTAPYGRVDSSHSRLANCLASRRGLVVAPGEWLRRTVIMDLGGCGMEMEGIADHGMALATLRGKKTDLLVLDFSRDWSACSDLVREVRDDETLHGTRIVALAPLDRVPDTHDATIDAWVDKPLRMRALVDAASGETAGSAKAAEVEEPAASERGPLSSSLRVLLVEDNPVNQKVARQLLRKRGYQNVVVSNGLEALAFLGANDCDIIFMDCQMPLMDGYATTTEIRRREGRDRHTWVVAMTAHSLDGDREKCIAAGMDDYMSKPVKIATLDAVMERYRMVIKEPVVESALASLREMGDEAMIGELVELFLQNAPEHLLNAREAFAEADLPKLARSIHSLKGSASNFGAQHLCELCARLEAVAHGHQGGEPAFLLDAIDHEFQCVARALEPSRQHVS